MKFKLGTLYRQFFLFDENRVHELNFSTSK